MHKESRREASIIDLTDKVFNDLYKTYHGRIYLFLFKMCNQKELAEDLTQETFVKAFHSFANYKGTGSVYTWLASIAKYTYFNYLRKNKLMMDAIPLDEAVNHFCANKYNIQNGEVAREEIYAAMQQLVYELPDNYKEVVLLRIYAEMSFKDVAATLNISESSAKVLYFRAKTKLKERLKNEFELQ